MTYYAIKNYEQTLNLITSKAKFAGWTPRTASQNAKFLIYLNIAYCHDTFLLGR